MNLLVVGKVKTLILFRSKNPARLNRLITPNLKPSYYASPLRTCGFPAARVAGHPASFQTLAVLVLSSSWLASFQVKSY
jgi:hypothetical protein